MFNIPDDDEKESLKPKDPWAAQERVRPPWVNVKYGETVAPPNEQTSNLNLTDEQVMQKRVQPIVSAAPPLNKGAGESASDDFSFTKKTGGDF